MPNANEAAKATRAELEGFRRQLEASGDYRVLRRLGEVERYRDDNDVAKFVAVYIDLETTGLDAHSDKIIELGMVAFEYDLNGNIYRVLRTANELEDPGEPLSDAVKEITGLSDEQLRGQRISTENMTATLGDARLVIAHNASFDRPFLEQRFPVFADLAWACSIDDVGWRELGYASAGLEFLAYHRGFFFDAHRALNDCRAGVELLAGPMGSGEGPTMALLRANALRNTVRIWAEDSPFHTKDLLKARGYRWNPSERVWWVEIGEEDHDAEVEWLAANVYGQRVSLPFFRVTAKERYSLRVPAGVTSEAERR